ncbi:MAG TPA: ATP-dependent DNA helicase RecG [Steroidobacteraceae bacterium]|nr:ATP-dependent DNA helicase RecG [Steroidobacteraceae bacterium]
MHSRAVKARAPRAAATPTRAPPTQAFATDPLFLLPARYEDRTRVTPIGALQNGARAVIEGEVQIADVIYRRRRALLVRISDGSGFLNLRFFYFSRAQQEGLVRGTQLRCIGEVRRGPQGLEMIHPEYRRIAVQPEPLEDRLTPIYPLTEGITQGRVRMAANKALAKLAANPAQDLLPEDVVKRLHLPTLREALEFVHHPPVGTSLAELAAGRHPAQRRLAFEELLAHQLSLQQLKQRIQSEPAEALHDRTGLAARFVAELPFALTGAQRRVLTDVERDLARDVPMVRLVQGDVGCGKTVVAAAAAARAVGSGRQAALMAPTELLAEQHWRSFDKWFRPLGLTVALLSGSQPARTRRSALEAVANGEVHIAVGTHALFQEGVQFHDLALAIVDEQHRFGVQQRLQLKEKGRRGAHAPHQLIMTATPIPRTLAMTAYADLDVSVIDELPPGRTPIRTVVLAEERRAEVVERIHAACREGRQAYWVCTLIEESEELRAQAAEETASQLAEALPGIRIGLVHGRMPPKAKEKAMHDFKDGRTQLLVATTVIEVGVDVPNASLMVIENAERMGLAQLHQLRGRVGRGTQESSCVLLYRAPLSQMARERLAAIRDSNDGFEIARKDLELRGPGELLGTRQTGLAALRVADLIRDADLLPKVRDVAEHLLRDNDSIIAPLRDRWIGGAEEYGRVG